MIESSELQPLKEFDITPKTTHEWLIEQPSLQDYGVRLQISDDMIANAGELESNIDWGEVLGYVTDVTNESKRYRGKLAIANSLAVTVGSLAKQMDWHMHSPEVVYMSGYHPYWTLGKEINTATGRIKSIENGESTFPTEEDKSKAIVTQELKRMRLMTYKGRLGNSLDAYSAQYLNGSDEYRRVLNGLLYSGHSKDLPRKRILQRLKDGEIHEAFLLIQPSEEASTS